MSMAVTNQSLVLKIESYVEVTSSLYRITSDVSINETDEALSVTQIHSVKSSDPAKLTFEPTTKLFAVRGEQQVQLRFSAESSISRISSAKVLVIKSPRAVSAGDLAEIDKKIVEVTQKYLPKAKVEKIKLQA